jgi:hypothetical protein
MFSRFNVIFFLAASCFFSIEGFAQWPSELWHSGKIVLNEGDTLHGLVKYDLQQDILQFSVRDQTADAYSARKVLFFEIFDETVNKYRQFFALPYENSSGYRAPIFFELLSEGKLTLLAREFLEYKMYSYPNYSGSISRLVLTYRFFFLHEDGSIEEFTGDKKDLIDLMGKKGKQVEKYIRTNRLKFPEKLDFARIVDYYNSLGS